MNTGKNLGLVSIIMPNFNGERYLKETIESVLAQTYIWWELLFIDDCSTDNSISIIESYSDNRIKILKNDSNSGAAASRNYGLREAKGKWIAFLDSDDIWLPQKLEKQLNFMNDNNYHFSYTSYVQINEDSTDRGIYVSGPKKINKRKMLQFNYIGCLTVIYDSEMCGVIQVDTRLKSKNDYAMWLKVARICNCYLFDEVLAKYRVRTNSISHKGLKKSLRNQYELFCFGERMGFVRSTYHTGVNIIFGILKKIFYAKKQ